MKKGFDGFTLKIIALILMVFDHIHYCFCRIWDIPLWFTMLGRLSAPLFIFMTAIGMSHTSSAKKYMLRLYIGSVFMSFFNNLINKYFPLPEGGLIFNGIFSTLFIITLMIYSIQKIEANRGNKKVIAKYVLIMFLPVISSVLVFSAVSTQNVLFIQCVTAFLPNVLFCEGSIIWVSLGIGFYLLRNSKKKTAVFYTIFSFLILLTGYNAEEGIISMLVYNIQWMMIFALPLILLYNGKKGRGMKYFFYIFYPAHIYIFTILAHCLANVG